MKRSTLAQMGVGLVLMAVATACGGSVERLTNAPVDPAAGGSASSQTPLDLLGSWQLVSVTPIGSKPIDAGEPGRFTAEFDSAGRVSLRADCNRCSGGYSATNSALTVGPMACTRAYCSSAPLDNTFTTFVGQTVSWTAANGQLELRAPAGKLLLRK